MMMLLNHICIFAKHTMCLVSLGNCSLVTAPCVTLRARFAHVKTFLRFFHGSVDFASLHGKDCSYNPIAFPPSMEVRCNLVGQCICPWMDGSRTTQERLSRSNCRGASHRPDSLTDFIKYLPMVCIPMKYPG